MASSSSRLTISPARSETMITARGTPEPTRGDSFHNRTKSQSGVPTIIGDEQDLSTYSRNSSNASSLLRSRSAVVRNKHAASVNFGDGQHDRNMAMGIRTNNSNNQLYGKIPRRLSSPISLAPSAIRMKKNAELKKLFGFALHQDENWIDDFVCAYQKEILVQGRLYITTHHLLFYSNIFGVVTKFKIDYADIASISKKNVALIIPNSIHITTVFKTEYFLSSFFNRDLAYKMILDVWYDMMVELNASVTIDDQMAALSTVRRKRSITPSLFGRETLRKGIQQIFQPKSRARTDTASSEKTMHEISTSDDEYMRRMDGNGHLQVHQNMAYAETFPRNLHHYNDQEPIRSYRSEANLLKVGKDLIVQDSMNRSGGYNIGNSSNSSIDPKLVQSPEAYLQTELEARLREQEFMNGYASSSSSVSTVSSSSMAVSTSLPAKLQFASHRKSKKQLIKAVISSSRHKEKRLLERLRDISWTDLVSGAKEFSMESSWMTSLLVMSAVLSLIMLISCMFVMLQVKTLADVVDELSASVQSKIVSM